MEQRKRLCRKHSFYYRGVECPFCLKERVSRFIPKTEIKEEDREATELELAALLNKFNGKI